MGFWDFLSRRSSIGSMHFTPNVQYLGADEIANALDGMSPAEMYRTQPHLRTVVSFLARNVAQLGLHTFERVGETDRRRDRESAVARALRSPDVNMTAYDLVFSLVGDKALYDTAYWYVGDSALVPGGKMIRRLPPSWVSPIMSDAYTVESYRVSYDGKYVEIPAANVLSFTGYAPSKPGGSSPTLVSLKDTLKEQIEASRYRNQVWARGGRVSSVLERPKDAPAWSDSAREQFREDWYAKYTGRGPKAGGTPILEDGMKLTRVDFNAVEQQFVEGAKLAMSTVASAFHVNPTMIGQLDNANFSNVREFRRMLYGDTLGPLLAEIEDRLNTFLLPMLGVDTSRFYVEFNIREKLEGSFEEQAAVMQTLVGAPIMTRNEGRSKFNLPRIEGGDDVVTPLNVLVGGQASPTDSGSQNVRSAPAIAVKAAVTGRTLKASPPANHVAKHEELLAEFFKRQGQVVKSRIGAGGDWWDAKRWDGELADTLVRLYALTSEETAKAALEELGLPDYDVDRTLAFLAESAKRSAKDINASTRDSIAAAIDDDDEDTEPLDRVANVFDVASGSRAAEIAVTSVAFASGFASLEVAKQNVSESGVTKTWNTTSGNPRASHASMDGETVPVDDVFSNGLRWPGGAGDPDEVAGCQCEMTINIP